MRGFRGLQFPNEEAADFITAHPDPGASHSMQTHPQTQAWVSVLVWVVVLAWAEEALPGNPGQDYPTLADVPKTSFRCTDPSGYFADVETGCQVYHVCENGRVLSSELCPNGTIFNQRAHVCDWWYDLKCEAQEIPQNHEPDEVEPTPAAPDILPRRSNNRPAFQNEDQI